MATLTAWTFASPYGADDRATLERLQSEALIQVQAAAAVSCEPGRRKSPWTGTSALFLLSSNEVIDRVRAEFQVAEAELISSNLSAEREPKVRP